MSVIQVIALSIIQGLAELLPVSSSAHVVVAEELMGLDPSAPAMTLLLVLLHTGTMFAVIVYFWKDWRHSYFSSRESFVRIVALVVVATALTGVLAEAVAHLLTRLLIGPHAQIEQLFGRLDLMAPALFAVGLLIIVSYFLERRIRKTPKPTMRQSALIGLIQGLSLPFRGFSRSGATISTGMLAGLDKHSAERFSFALAVVLTPPVVIREIMRLEADAPRLTAPQVHSAIGLGILGGVLAFLAGLVALRWLSAWLERGRWYYFGVYCLLAAIGVELLLRAGY